MRRRNLFCGTFSRRRPIASANTGLISVTPSAHWNSRQFVKFVSKSSSLRVKLVSLFSKLFGLFFHSLFQRLFLGDALLRRVFPHVLRYLHAAKVRPAHRHALRRLVCRFTTGWPECFWRSRVSVKRRSMLCPRAADSLSLMRQISRKTRSPSVASITSCFNVFIGHS